uniref:RING-type domain-containing protein n=1 Tax=Lygus hesperus TaxID=30085 RepID=A0A0K8SN88_LYGHE
MNVECTICTDAVNVLKEGNETLTTSALSCGHVFHSDCIVRWIDQSGRQPGTCPQCRSIVTKKNILRLFFDLVPSENYQDEKINELKKVVQFLRGRLSRETQINSELREQNSVLELNLASAQKNSDVLKEKLIIAQRNPVLRALMVRQSLELTTKSKELDDAKHEIEKLRRKRTLMTRAWNRSLNGPSTDNEVRDLLAELDRNDMALLFLSIKKDREELSRCQAELSRCQDEARRLKQYLSEAQNLNEISEPNSVGPSTSSSSSNPSVEGMMAGPSTGPSQAPLKRKLPLQISHPSKAPTKSSVVSSVAGRSQLRPSASAIPNSNGGPSKTKTEPKNPGKTGAVRKSASLLNRPPWQ